MKTIFIFSLLIGLSAFANYRVHIKKSGQQTEVLSFSSVEKQNSKLLRSLPYYIAERQYSPAYEYQEWIMDAKQIQKFDLTKAKSLFARQLPNAFAESEVRVLVQQGPKENRINLTILGDGYTQIEKNKFFADCERTVQGLFGDSTFKSYLPLFNVYAVFVPSQQSGIGDGSPIKTAFQLYRYPRGSKRAIYPGNEAALEAALNLAPATDYPIVLANDEYYGGLGGRYAITTSSLISGQVVLRHELGHNLGEVGEEYDTGMAYFGANNSNSANVSWSHWVEGKTKVNEAKLVSGNYVWQNLANNKYQTKFKTNFFPNGFFYGLISSVGWDSEEDVLVSINNQALKLNGTFNSDRNFYEITPVKNFPSGEHTFSVEEKIKDGNNVLGFAQLFVTSSDYDFTANKIGAYATFNEHGTKSYRPTHSSCLMRDMAVDYFCSVDKENIWHKLLNRVKLIDQLEVTNNGKSLSFKLSTLPLPDLQIRWFKKSGIQYVEMPELANKLEWNSSNSNEKIKVKVSFRSPEVRKFNQNFDDEVMN